MSDEKEKAKKLAVIIGKRNALKKALKQACEFVEKQRNKS